MKAVANNFLKTDEQKSRVMLQGNGRGSACTIISISKKKTVLFGANKDLKPIRSFHLADKNAKLDVIYFAAPLKYYPLVMLMGINEKSLADDTNTIPPEKFHSRQAI